MATALPALTSLTQTVTGTLRARMLTPSLDATPLAASEAEGPSPDPDLPLGPPVSLAECVGDGACCERAGVDADGLCCEVDHR